MKAMKEKNAEGVRAVDRALDILLAFGAGDRDLTAGELLKRVDLSRPTLYRLLYTLEQSGFVTATGEPQRFSLGPSIGRLSWAWTSNQDVAEVARPYMQELWTLTNETVALFKVGGYSRICIAEIPSPQPLCFKRGVGYSERIVLGASGRALLAWMDSSAELLSSFCDGLEIEPKALEKELEKVRSQGFAVSHDELIQGAVAIATPFFDNSGKIAGSLGVFGPAVRMNSQRIDEIAPMLIDVSNRLSASMGKSLKTIRSSL